jgi:MFS family permease
VTAGMIDEKPAALARQLLAESREELNRADAKAASLFAVFGIAFGVVLAGLIAGNWTPSDLPPAAGVVWWVGAACAALAMVAVGAAVWPRVDSKHATGRITYFGHVAGYRSREALCEALERQASEDLDRPVEQLETVSRIVMLKYTCIRAALLLYGIGAATCTLAVLIS